LDEDLELKMINARKLAAMRRRAEIASAAAAASQAPPKPEKTPRELVLETLYDRGDEVLSAAYQAYPRETEAIVVQLARLLKQAGARERISGGELYSLFRSLGLRFSLKTTIKVEERGKFVELKDKLKMDMEEG